MFIYDLKMLVCYFLTVGNLIDLGSLIVAAVGLRYIIKYVGYTKTIAEEAISQTEAGSKPALLAVFGDSTGANCKLRNVGKGPALDIEWHLTNSDQHGRFSCIEAGTSSDDMLYSNLKTITNAAMKAKEEEGKEYASIICSYRSLSGKRYDSVNLHVLTADGRDRFSTTFNIEVAFAYGL